MKHRSQIKHQQMKPFARYSPLLKLGMLLVFCLLQTTGWSQSLIAGWDFQTTTNGGTAAAVVPNSPTTYVANFGTGSLYLNGTNGSSTWITANTGNQITSFGGTALNAGTGFSTTTTGAASLALVSNVANGKSIVFAFGMAGKANLIVSYATQRSGTGFTSHIWEYSTNGTTWSTAQTLATIPTAFATQTLTTINGLDNAATAFLRLTVNGASAATGNNRLDNIQLNASIAAPPVVANDMATATVGTPFSHFISATNAPTLYGATGMPTWMSLNTTTGELIGTPTTVAGAVTVSTEATNGTGTGTGSTLVTVNQGSQTITFGALTPATFGNAPFNLTATGGSSGNSVTYVSSNPLAATISGNVVTIVGAGSTSITASQAGNTDYSAATDVSQTLTVNQATQTITFNPLATKLTTDPAFALTATGGGSGNPVTYVSSDPSVASIAGNVVTIVSAGTTNITASQAGNANYLAAISVTQAQLVNPAGLISQTITFNALPAVTYGIGTVTLTATGGGSGNPVTYVSSNTGVGTIAGNVLTIVGAGSTDITASQAGNGSYSAATSLTQTQVVNVKELTVPGAAAFNKVYDGTTDATLFNLTLSGLVGADVVTVSGGGTFASANVGTNLVVTSNLVLAGANSANYSLTQPTGLVADITEASQTILFGALPTKTFGNAPFTISATGGGSGNPVTFISDNPAVATVSGNTVTIIGVGTANITASQVGDANHFAATPVDQVLTVNKANQNITFAQLPTHALGEPDFALTATVPSGLTVTFTSSNPFVASVIGNIVTIVGVGTTVITASQSGNTNYNAANDVSRDLLITYPLIAAWDFFGQSSPVTFSATTFDADLVATGGLNNITRGPNAATNNAGNSFRTVAFQNNGIATTNTDYFQTTLKATSGHSLSLSSINAFFAGTATYAAAPGVSSQFAYSVNGTNFTLIASPFTTVGTPVTSPLIDVTSISALQNIHASQTVTIRYYATRQTATGGWGLNSPIAGVNGLAFGGNLNVCVPQTNTSSVTICASATPYIFGTQSLTSSGTYTNTAVNAQGCDSIEILNLTVNSCTNSVLNLKCFIQAYYAGSSSMTSVLANQGEISTATASDSIDVELRDENTPTIIVASVRVILNQDGTAECNFPALTGNYYIVVKHRSAIQTWSAMPVSFATSPVNYNFSNADSKAYGNNMILVDTGVWAFYSGDVAVDENMDLLDLGLVETDISNFGFGYLATDLNGDGNVDLLDSAPIETNISNFIFSNHP